MSSFFRFSLHFLLTLSACCTLWNGSTVAAHNDDDDPSLRVKINQEEQNRARRIRQSLHALLSQLKTGRNFQYSIDIDGEERIFTETFQGFLGEGSSKKVLSFGEEGEWAIAIPSRDSDLDLLEWEQKIHQELTRTKMLQAIGIPALPIHSCHLQASVTQAIPALCSHSFEFYRLHEKMIIVDHHTLRPYWYKHHNISRISLLAPGGNITDPAVWQPLVMPLVGDISTLFRHGVFPDTDTQNMILLPPQHHWHSDHPHGYEARFFAYDLHQLDKESQPFTHFSLLEHSMCHYRPHTKVACTAFTKLGYQVLMNMLEILIYKKMFPMKKRAISLSCDKSHKFCSSLPKRGFTMLCMLADYYYPLLQEKLLEEAR